MPSCELVGGGGARRRLSSTDLVATGAVAGPASARFLTRRRHTFGTGAQNLRPA